MLVLVRQIDQAVVVQLDDHYLQKYLQTPAHQRDPLVISVNKIGRYTVQLGFTSHQAFRIFRSERAPFAPPPRTNALLLTRKAATSVTVQLREDLLEDYLQQDSTKRIPLTVLVSGINKSTAKLLFSGPHVFRVLRSEMQSTPNVKSGTAPPVDDDPNPPAFSPQPS